MTKSTKKRKSPTECIQAMNDAIETLKSRREDINESSVAREADVSRNTVRKNDAIMERIESFRKAKSKKDLKTTSREEYDKLKAQHNKIKKIEEELESAMLQLVAMEELKRSNEEQAAIITRLKKQIKDLIRDNTILKNGDNPKDIVIKLIDK